MAKALTPPDLNIPASQNTVDVSIIDTTALVTVPASRFVKPHYKGMDNLSACCYSFLIKHNNPSSKTKHDTMVFDLGVRKDFENSPKVILDSVKASGMSLPVEKNVVDILRDHNEDPKNVGAIIWSHWHLDHTGDPSTFPSSTDLIVGPGFKGAFVPGWPTNQDSPVDEKAWEGRTLREIDFDGDGKSLRIGQYKAFDFYGDGSFYFLDTPGHAIGHMCGLARTSADPPEFIFMGGDIAHHGAEFRPTQYLPLPETVPAFSKNVPVCPGSMFEAIHRNKSSTEPFYVPVSDGVHHDSAEATRSIEKLYEFDAHDNVFVNIAHDMTIYDVVEYYPKTANGWSQKGWKQDGRWRFLQDLEEAAKNP